MVPTMLDEVSSSNSGTNTAILPQHYQENSGGGFSTTPTTAKPSNLSTQSREYVLPLNDEFDQNKDGTTANTTCSDKLHGSNSSQFSFASASSFGDPQNRTLLEEIREVLAQSYLIFLIADLRLMSGTGRICTLYEHLAIDSDVYPKNTAAQLACMVLPQNESKEEEKYEDNSEYYQTENKATMVARGPDQPSKSLSPANIMAILLLEIRDTFVHTAGSEENPEVGQALMTYREDKVKRRDLEDSMTSLLRAYARMISEDLVTEIPYVRRRRMSVTHSGPPSNTIPRPVPSPSMPLDTPSLQDSQPEIRPSSWGLTSIQEETSVELAGSTVEFKASTSVQEESGIEANVRHQDVISKPDLSKREPETSKTTADQYDSDDKLRTNDANTTSSGTNQSQSIKINPTISNLDSESSESKTPGKKMSIMNSPQNPFSSARREQLVHQVSQRKDQLAEEAKQFAANMNHRRQTVVQEINDRVDPNREGNAKKEFEELTNALFDEGGENKQVMSSIGGSFAPGEMLRVMRRAVETRNDGQLQFLSRIFKEGSVSHLLVESHSRLVWMNDWYPLKDLTYAIAVDTRLKRVLVVFRGAITAQDWRTVMHYSMETIPNPVQEDFEGKKEKIRVFSGFYEYLFRVRKDTGTTKYSEIASLAHKYGIDKIGKDYKLFVTGHSLGGALTNFFCFFASTEERFTRNGPVQAIAFAGPYCGGHSFADSFRHQERRKKLQFIRVANNSDMVPRLPMNFRIGRRGCRWRHVGIGVTMPKIPWFGKWKPLMHYYGKEKSWFGSTVHGYMRNFIFHTPFLRPWTIARMHTLFELQDRLMYGELQSNPGGDFTMLNQTMDELYEGLEEEDFQNLKGMKTKQKWR